MTSPNPDEGITAGGCLEWHMKAGRCLLAAVAVLALFNVARSLGLLGPPRYAWIPVSLLTVTLVLIAWTAGATRADLGLDPTDMRAGVRYGACAVGIVLLVLIVASALPAVAGASASVAGRVLVVLGSVAVTFAAGLIFCWLRLRSRSLIAPVMAHCATNGLALAVAWFTIRHGRIW